MGRDETVNRTAWYQSNTRRQTRRLCAGEDFFSAISIGFLAGGVLSIAGSVTYCLHTCSVGYFAFHHCHYFIISGDV